MNYSLYRKENNPIHVQKYASVERKEPKGSKTNTSSVGVHQCHKCGLLNHNAWSLTLHMRRHNNERPAKCSYCLASFINNSELKIHMSIHTKEKNYKCRFCTKRFAHRSTKYYHEDTHGILQHKCKFCPLTFTTQVERRIHHKTHVKEDFSCRLCIKKFASQEFLKHHVNLYHSKKPVKCSQCKLIFNSQGELNVHKLIHKNESQNLSPAMKVDDLNANNVSHKSNQSFSTNKKKNEVKYFQDSDVELSSYFYTCGICSNKFEFHSDLSKHIENAHSKEERENIYRFKCVVCSKSYDSNIKLRAHMISHGPKKFKCPHCAYSSTRGKDLSKHINAKHVSNKNIYKCSECQKQFSAYSTFINHKLRHGDKKFKCDLCDKAFYLKVRLSIHKRNCHYSNNSICEHCGKVFTHRDSLRDHQRRCSNHYLSSVCVCSLCGKTIKAAEIQSHRTSCPLETTMHTIKKVKRLLCSKCFVSFSCKRNLIEHFTDFHPLEIFTCQFCSKRFLSQPHLQQHIDRKHHSNNPALKKQKHLLSTDEKKQLKRSVQPFFIDTFYECFACGDSFNNELSMNDHCNNGLCLRSKDGESSHEKENYFITKLHHEMHKTRVLNDFIVKVIPVYLNHEPLGTEMVSPNDAHLIKNIEKKNLFEFHTEKLKKKLNEFKPQLFENESVKKSQVLLQEKSNIENFCNKSENLSFEHLSIISSESLVGLLQNKTINIDGTTFISYSELVNQLKTISGINVNIKS
ncbi:UNVERIFIED_CONTAM: hypothetical protein RMT77_001756 [Armadillidium vulgare]